MNLELTPSSRSDFPSINAKIMTFGTMTLIAFLKSIESCSIGQLNNPTLSNKLEDVIKLLLMELIS
jgi:hypothetical protein